MRILILLLFCLNITYVKADEIYNLLKIPNLEIFKLKSKNNIYEVTKDQIIKYTNHAKVKNLFWSKN